MSVLKSVLVEVEVHGDGLGGNVGLVGGGERAGYLSGGGGGGGYLSGEDGRGGVLIWVVLGDGGGDGSGSNSEKIFLVYGGSEKIFLAFKEEEEGEARSSR